MLSQFPRSTRLILSASVVLMSCIVATFLTQPACADDVAATAASANKASVEMIRAYYADVEQTQTIQGKESKRTAQYWRSHTTMRAVEQTRPKLVTDVTVKSGTQFVVEIHDGKVAGKEESIFGALVTGLNRRTLETDPWEVGLHSLPLGLVTKPPKRIYTLADIVQKGTVRESGWVQNGTKRVARMLIDCDAGERTYEVWVDPGTNWMIDKCILTMREAGAVTWINEFSVEEFRELKPSIFVPVRCKAVLQFRGEKVVVSDCTMKNIVINEKLPKEPLSPIPAGGTRAFDELANTTYTINAAAVRTGTPVPIGREYTPPASVLSPREDPLAPSSVRSWFGVTAVGLAFVSIVIGLVVRRRSRRG